MQSRRANTYEGDLRPKSDDLKAAQGIKCYRGIRHMRGLPVPASARRPNEHAAKGPRKTVGGAAQPNAKTGITKFCMLEKRNPLQKEKPNPN